MKKIPTRGLLLCAIICLTPSMLFACTNFNVSFSHKQNKNCGLSRQFSFANTSSGSNSTTAEYQWIVDSKVIKTYTGKVAFEHTFFTPGQHEIMLIGKDTSGCKDTFTITPTITTNSTQIIDQSTSATYTPYWQNCILLPNTPDTFDIELQTKDTAFDYRIEWGDGQSDSGKTLLKTQKIKHGYKSLGTFTLLFISKNGSCIDTLYGTVINERQPVAGLIGPATGTNFGCVPLKVKFKNYSQNISSSTSFLWSMGDTIYNFPASTFRDSFYHTYYESYCDQTVSLVATNACGESSATWRPIHASDKDSAGIDVLNPTNCDLSKDFIIQNRSSDKYCIFPDNKSYYWDFGDGSNSGWIKTTANQKHKYSKEGTYVITLLNKNYCGVDSAKYILVINALPKTNIAVTQDIGCNPITASFADITSNSPNLRYWNFGDTASGNDNVSTDSFATHTYKTPGKYLATLKVSNVCGTVIDTTEIIVHPSAKASFKNLPSKCYPVKQTFVNTSRSHASNVTYHWDFGDNTSSTAKNPPYKVYTTPGTYTVRLIVTDSCNADTFSQTFKVHDYPVSAFKVTSPTTCSNQKIDFLSTSTNGVNYVWNFGDTSKLLYTYQGAVSHTYKHSTNYKATLIAKNGPGCADTSSIIVTINPLDKAIIKTSKPDGCDNLSVVFEASTSGKSSHNTQFYWDFGNGKNSTKAVDTSIFTAALNNDSLYNIKLATSNKFGCKDSSTTKIKVYPNPVANFSLPKESGCAPLDLEFNNLSIPKDTGDISMMSFKWLTGNGETKTTQNIKTTYTESLTKDSIYYTKLIAYSEHGCVDSLTKSQTVYPNPTIRFSADTISGCSPLKVNFTNSSSPNDTGSIDIMNFHWDFRNGKTSSQQHANAEFNASPTKDSTIYIYLTGYSEHQCSTKDSTPIIIFPRPKVDFDMSVVNGCSPLKVDFKDKSSNYKKQDWWFGGKHSSQVDPSNLFIESNFDDSIIYISHAVISDKNCISDTIRKPLTIFGKPHSDFTFNKNALCNTDTIQILNNSKNAVSHHWILEKNCTSTEFNPKNVYRRSAIEKKDTTYYPMLISKSIKGCLDTACYPITVKGKQVLPIQGLNLSGCSPYNVPFNLTQGIKNVFWDFNDGTFSRNPNINHVFENLDSSAKKFLVSLTFELNNCIDTNSLEITVYPKTEANFTQDRLSNCDSGFFQFTNYSSNASTHFWDFGNGNTSNLENPLELLKASHYSDTMYQVKYSVQSQAGCISETSRNIVIGKRLKVDMVDSTLLTCMFGEVQFQDKSLNAIKHFWDFGDGTGSSLKNPKLSFTKPGTYNYSLFAYDANGCYDSIVSTNTLKVMEKPKAKFSFSPVKPKIPNSTVYFKDESSSSFPLSYNWELCQCDSVVTSNLKDPVHTYYTPGTKIVTLTITNGSCSDHIIDSFYVEPPLPIPAFDIMSNDLCAPGGIQFVNNSQHATDFTWFFGDGKSSKEKSPLHSYAHSGTYTVILVANGPGGKDILEMENLVHIKPTPFARFSLTPNVAHLPKALFYTKNESSDAHSYYWSWTDSDGAFVGSSGEENPTILMEDTGFYNLQLIAENENTCTDTFHLKDAMLVNPRGYIYVPNAFTPNTDNVNDVFLPKHTNLDRSNYEFKIMNRWGEVVFRTSNPDEAWTGENNGEKCKQDVYVWMINAQFIQGERIEQRGVVHLLR